MTALKDEKAKFPTWKIDLWPKVKILWNFSANLFTTEKQKLDMTQLSLFAVSDNAISLQNRRKKTKIYDNLQHSASCLARCPAVVLMLRRMQEENHRGKTESVSSLVL